MKVLHSICQQIWKTQQWPQEWKRSVFIPIPKKGNAKKCSKWKWSRSVMSDSLWPVDCSPPSSSIHGILQARILEWVAISFSKECSNHHTIALISHDSKVIHKFFQARLQKHMNWELPDVQAGFRKGRGTRAQIAIIHWIIKESKSVSEKHLLVLYWLHQSLWLCGSQQTVKFFKR